MNVKNPESGNLNRRDFLRRLAIAAKGVAIAALMASGLRASSPEESEQLFSERESKLIEELLTIPIYQKIMLPRQVDASSVENRNIQMYNEAYSTEHLGELSIQLNLQYSPNRADIHPEMQRIRPGFLPNFEKVPEIVEARRNPNLEQRLLTIITALGVCTKEEIAINKRRDQLNQDQQPISHLKDIILNEIDNLRRNENVSRSLRNKFPTIELVNAKEAELKLLSQKIDSMDKTIEDLLNKIIYELGNPSWNDEHINFCNLYATTLLEALNLSHRAGHWVDSSGNIVADGNGRELNAQGMHNWFKEHGERHGWIDVTNKGFSELISMLEQGYIFYGSTKEHNWIIGGITIDGRCRPFLTQATDNTSVKLFPEVRTNVTDPKLVLPNSQDAQDSYDSLAMIYKLKDIFKTGNAILYAIHMDDSKNPPIRK